MGPRVTICPKRCGGFPPWASGATVTQCHNFYRTSILQLNTTTLNTVSIPSLICHFML